MRLTFLFWLNVLLIHNQKLRKLYQGNTEHKRTHIYTTAGKPAI